MTLIFTEEKNKESLNDISEALSNIKKVAEEYRFLWDKNFIQNYLGEDILDMFHPHLIIKDDNIPCEANYIGISNYLGQLEFCNYRTVKPKIHLTTLECARKINELGIKYNRDFKPSELISCFYNAIKKPLGEYLAEKQLQEKPKFIDKLSRNHTQNSYNIWI